MPAFSRQHTWGAAFFFSFSIALCICIDIFQHSVPLPFLPQALSAQGHSTMQIAAVMGSYYWSGCAGGALLTLYQVHRVLFGEHTEPTWAEMRSHVRKLILGLTIGMLTLLAEAKNPDWIPDIQVHLCCRLTQGFVGAFLFFYSYLLSVKLFEGPQQVFALTAASIALNVAEVFGPLLGAAIFTAYGSGAPYVFLAVLSVLNNLLLWAVLRCLPEDDPKDEESAALLPAAPQAQRSFADRMQLLRCIFSEPSLWRAVLVIAPAAAVKSCFESMLPLFGGQKNYDELSVGLLFCVCAVAYIAASVSIGYCWLSMSPTSRNLLITFSLGGLACAAGAVFTSYKVNWHLDEIGLFDFTRHEVFYLFLFAYGLCLGLTHTPAAYLLGNAVDAYEDAAAQDAVNGIFNTCWELGGSLGFILAGFASQHDWRQEQFVLGACGAVVGMSAFLFILTSAREAGGLMGASPEPLKLKP